MANSKYEYVRSFEQPDNILPNTWIVVRIDGRGFHKLSAKYHWTKPNDKRAIDLMNAAAIGVMTELPDLIIAYGVSDEYSFVFHPTCGLFDRRAGKLATTVASTFTAYFVLSWSVYFADTPLSSPLPSFDGRCVAYPTLANLRDYMSWRQVDCHINNLYNTTFWTLIQNGDMDAKEAEKLLQGTYSADKNEILFSRFGINYNNEPEVFKKGSVVFRDYERSVTKSPAPREPGTVAKALDSNISATDESGNLAELSKTAAERERKIKGKVKVVVEHMDIIKNEFWEQRPWILTGRPGKLPKET